MTILTYSQRASEQASAHSTRVNCVSARGTEWEDAVTHKNWHYTVVDVSINNIGFLTLAVRCAQSVRKREHEKWEEIVSIRISGRNVKNRQKSSICEIGREREREEERGAWAVGWNLITKKPGAMSNSHLFGECWNDPETRYAVRDAQYANNDLLHCNCTISQWPTKRFTSQLLLSPLHDVISFRFSAVISRMLIYRFGMASVLTRDVRREPSIKCNESAKIVAAR